MRIGVHDKYSDIHIGTGGGLLIDTFGKGLGLPRVRSNVMEACCRALIREGSTLSSNLTTNVAIGGRQPVDFRLIEGRSKG